MIERGMGRSGGARKRCVWRTEWAQRMQLGTFVQLASVVQGGPCLFFAHCVAGGPGGDGGGCGGDGAAFATKTIGFESSHLNSLSSLFSTAGVQAWSVSEPSFDKQIPISLSPLSSSQPEGSENRTILDHARASGKPRSNGRSRCLRDKTTAARGAVQGNYSAATKGLRAEILFTYQCSKSERSRESFIIVNLRIPSL